MAYFPTDICSGPNFSWLGGGPYSQAGGHWECFTDSGKLPDPDWDEYTIGYTECMGYAKSRGVPDKDKAAWCGGWPADKVAYRYADPPDPPSILVPVVIFMVIIGAGFFYFA